MPLEMKKDLIRLRKENEMKNIFLALILLFVNAGPVTAEDKKDNPLFVTITAKWCTTCNSLKSTLEELEYIYNEKVNFLTLDISNKESLETSNKKAEEAGITSFFDTNKMNLPTVGIFCNSASKPDKIFTGESNRNIYEQALQEIFTSNHKICSL